MSFPKQLLQISLGFDIQYKKVDFSIRMLQLQSDVWRKTNIAQ